MSGLVDARGRPLAGTKVSGKIAVRMMVEEIGDAIGWGGRMNEFERKVRLEMAHVPRRARTSNDWIQAMATVIARDDDTLADKGFVNGIRRIRRAAGES